MPATRAIGLPYIISRSVFDLNSDPTTARTSSASSPSNCDKGDHLEKGPAHARRCPFPYAANGLKYGASLACLPLHLESRQAGWCQSRSQPQLHCLKFILNTAVFATSAAHFHTSHDDDPSTFLLQVLPPWYLHLFLFSRSMSGFGGLDIYLDAHARTFAHLEPMTGDRLPEGRHSDLSAVAIMSSRWLASEFWQKGGLGMTRTQHRDLTCSGPSSWESKSLPSTISFLAKSWLECAWHDGSYLRSVAAASRRA